MPAGTIDFRIPAAADAAAVAAVHVQSMREAYAGKRSLPAF